MLSLGSRLDRKLFFRPPCLIFTNIHNFNLCSITFSMALVLLLVWTALLAVSSPELIIANLKESISVKMKYLFYVLRLLSSLKGRIQTKTAFTADKA